MVECAPATAAPAAADGAGDDGATPDFTFRTRFQGKELVLPPLGPLACVGDLKALLQDETAVPAVRQKLIGLVKGKVPDDSLPLATLDLKGSAPYRFTLMGTPDDKLRGRAASRRDLESRAAVFDRASVGSWTRATATTCPRSWTTSTRTF